MSISIIGAGSWGTALAQAFSKKVDNILLYGRDKKVINDINKTHQNKKYLPNIKLNKNIKATDNIKETIENSEIIIIAIPTQTIKEFLEKIKNFNVKNKIFISASKGIDIDTLELVSEMIYKGLSIDEENVFALSGPSFAKEVAQGLPTAITLAGEICKAKELQNILSSENFRLYISEDIKGVELAGAVKNVIAIATGISDGLNLGNNARAGLITRGLYEINKLVNILGGKTETIYGLAGLGDLVLTATGNLSRNRRFGLLIGQGKKSEEALKEIGQVVEGVKTVKAVKKISEKYNLELPISEMVYKIIYEGLSPKKAVKKLMSRQPKKEFQ